MQNQIYSKLKEQEKELEKRKNIYAQDIESSIFNAASLGKTYIFFRYADPKDEFVKYKWDMEILREFCFLNGFEYDYWTINAKKNTKTHLQNEVEDHIFRVKLDDSFIKSYKDGSVNINVKS